MSPCPSCGAVRGAHRQEYFCDDCDQEGCVRCMANGLCPRCTDVRRRCFDGLGAPIRIAVDLDGELAELSRALLELDSAKTRLVRAAVRRMEAEHGEQQRHKGYVGDSDRSDKLRSICRQLEWCSGHLTEAMIGSTTMTDEIPF